MGIPHKAFDCNNELRKRFLDDNSDEVSELRPVILVKIYYIILLQTHFEEKEEH